MEFLPPVAAVQTAGVAATSPAAFLPSSTLANAAIPDASGTQSLSFSSLVTDGLSKVNTQLMTGQQDLQRLAVGDVQNLHQVMIQLEETRLSFQLMMQVRNRLLESYQDLMKMSI